MTDRVDSATPPADGIWGTINGVPVTDDDVQDMITDADAGFPDATFRPVGRPRSVGHRPARTVTVRLDPERVRAIQARADRDHTTASEIMRRALDHYLAG